LLEKCNLLLDIVDIVILCIQVDDLERDDMGGGDMSTTIDSSIRALSEDLELLDGQQCAFWCMTAAIALASYI
jgi:hypothetical protein